MTVRNTSAKSRETPCASWKTLLLGGFLGYLIAVFTRESSSPALHRWLSSKNDNDKGSSFESGEEGEEELETDASTMDAALTAIVLFLILVTIVFEKVKESIEEAADRTMEPVIEGLFGELTVLGFLSIVTFCVTKLGWFTTLSIHLFGEEEEEELLETFEMVHYMLFFVMVFFVVNVLVLVFGGEAMGRQWWTYNMACRDAEYMAQLDALQSSNVDNFQKTTYIQYLCRQTVMPLLCFCCRSSTRQFQADLQLFRGLRHEFVLERSVEPPFAPHPSAKRVDDDFNFGRYLTICLGHELGHMVHLNMATWLVLALLTVIFYGIALAIDNKMETFAWIWAGTGWLLFLLGNYFDFHMVHLLESMASVHSSVSKQQSHEEDALLNDSTTLPLWTRIDLESYVERGRPFLVKMFVPKKLQLHATRQDSLYWLERKGPKLYLILFQIQLVFTAAYVSLLLLSFYPYLFVESEQSKLERGSYVILSLLPVYLLLTKYQTAAANLTMACSIGVHRRPQAVSQVIREGKTDSIIRAMVTMQKLQKAANNGFSHPSSGSHANIGRAPASSAFELEAIGKTFDALDKSGDGTIEFAELSNVLKASGAAVTQESLDAMIKVLDKNNDGHISKAEFLDFYRAHMVYDLDHHGLRHLAKDMFDQIDNDSSGEITLGEFKEVLDAFNVGFSVDEIGDLVNELDEEDNGTIGQHEFVELLEKHRHLFERVSLPPLE